MRAVGFGFVALAAHGDFKAVARDIGPAPFAFFVLVKLVTRGGGICHWETPDCQWIGMQWIASTGYGKLPDGASMKTVQDGFCDETG